MASFRDELVKSGAYLKLYQGGLLDLDVTLTPKRAKVTAKAMEDMAVIIDNLRQENEALRLTLMKWSPQHLPPGQAHVPMNKPGDSQPAYIWSDGIARTYPEPPVPFVTDAVRTKGQPVPRKTIWQRADEVMRSWFSQ